MGRYTSYLNFNSIYFMLNGYTKCLFYIKKGVKECNGVFSVDEFNALIVQRNRLLKAAYRKDEEIKGMLVEATYVQLALSQANVERKRLQRKVDGLLRKQEKMLVQELKSLDELNYVNPPLVASSTILVALNNT